MSFLDESRTSGAAFLGIGILTIIVGIISIVSVLMDGEQSKLNAVVGVGTIICGALYLLFGKQIYDGNITEKWDILTTFVKIVGIATIIGGVFSLVVNVAGGVVSIILGLIILFIYSKMTDAKVGVGDKIIWILLLVIFIFGIIGGLMELFSFPIGTLSGICDIIIYVFMTLALLDGEVKSKMGM